MRSLNAEIPVNIVAKEALEMFMSIEILSKIDPNIIASVEYIRGNGGPGSLRLFKLGPALKNYMSEALEEIETLDIGRSLKYKVIGGELAERYSPYIVSLTFVPVEGKEKEQCTLEYEVEVEPVSPETPPPDKSMEILITIFKLFEDYKKHHQ